VDGKGPDVAVNVQHPIPRPHHPSQPSAVLPLIQIEPGLLPADRAGFEDQPVLLHLQRIRDLPPQQASPRLQPLVLPGLHIAALIDPPGREPFAQRVHQHLPPALHPQVPDLHHQDVAVAIDDQPGEPIRLPVDQADGVRVPDAPSPVGGLRQAPPEPLRIHRLVPPGEHSKGDMGRGVVERPPHQRPRGVPNLHDGPRLRVPVNAGDVIVEGPGVEIAELALRVGLEDDPRLHTASRRPTETMNVSSATTSGTWPVLMARSSSARLR
jgi:hypothetical protein